MGLYPTGRRVLVIGGTGFLGRRIAEQFVARGDQVTILTRGLRSVDDLAGVEQLVADRHAGAAFDAALAGRMFDVVVDNIAYDETDVVATLRALNGRVKHYLLTSTAAVYTPLQTRRPIRERDADLAVRLSNDVPDAFHPRLGQVYGNGKRAAEAALRDGGVPWTVLRPPVIVGPDDRTERIWWFVQRILDGGPIVLPDWGAGRLFQVAWADDVARAFCVAAANPAAMGRAYNVAQAEVFSAETWVEDFAAVLGRTASYAHIPETELERAGLGDYTLPIAGRPLGHVLVDTSAIRHDLGFEATGEATWLTDTVCGTATRHAADQNQHGYERRADEVRAARQVLTQS